MAKKIVFKQLPIADVSTSLITDMDSVLLLDDAAPFVIAKIAGGTGVLMVVPVPPEESANDTLREFGFSTQFMDLFSALRRQKFQYVRFDEDGLTVHRP